MYCIKNKKVLLFLICMMLCGHIFFAQPFQFYKRFSVSHPGSGLFEDTMITFKFLNDNTIQINDFISYSGFIRDLSNIKKAYRFLSNFHNLISTKSPYYPYVGIVNHAYQVQSYIWVENVQSSLVYVPGGGNHNQGNFNTSIEGKNVWNHNLNKFLPLHEDPLWGHPILYSYWIGNGLGWFVRSAWRTSDRKFLNAGYIQLGIQKACAWFYILDSTQKRKSSIYKDTSAFASGASSYFNTCFQDMHNSYVMAGKINIPNALGYISKMRPSLLSYESYVISFPGKDSGEIMRARHCPDGNYILSGHVWENGKRRLFLMKADSSLQSIHWALQLNPKNAPENLYMTDLLHEKNSRYVITAGNGHCLIFIPFELPMSFNGWLKTMTFREKGMFCLPGRVRNLYNAYNKIYHIAGILKDSVNPQIRSTFFLRTDTTFKIKPCQTPKTSLYFISDSLPVQLFTPVISLLSNTFPDTLGAQVYTVSSSLLDNSTTGTISFPLHQTNFSTQWQPTVVLNGTSFCEGDKITFNCFPAPPVVTNYFYSGPNQFTAQPASQQFNILMAQPGHTGIYTIEAHFNSGCITTTQTPLISVNQRPDTSVTLTGSMLMANQTNAAYQWLDCHTNQPLPNGINQFYIVSQPGYYKVALNMNGCRDTSRCFPIGVDELTEWNATHGFPWKIGPNPNPGNLLYVYPPQNNLSYSCEITDLPGRVLIRQNCTGPSTLNVSSLSAGNIYLLNIKEKNYHIKKIFKLAITK
jgi:hypothetical protein